jgi:hypothetical protein
MRPRVFAIPLLLGCALFGHIRPAAADGPVIVVPWLKVPAAVRDAATDKAPDGGTMGQVEMTMKNGKIVYDVHVILGNGQGEKVLEFDKNGHSPEPLVLAPEPPPPPEPAAATEAPPPPPVPKPEKTGLEEFSDSAIEGNAKQEYEIGQHFEYGSQGERQDYAQAATWYKKAVSHGSAAAAFSLGNFYTDGLGVQKNDAEAAQWYRKAAEGGHVDGQFNLGQINAHGTGVPQNWKAACFWFTLAAQNHAKGAEAARDEAAKHLTAKQLEDIKAKLATWKPDISKADQPEAPVAPATIVAPPVEKVDPTNVKSITPATDPNKKQAPARLDD